MPKSVHVITSHVQKASRIVQNGACTQKQAFVYRVLCSHHALHTARCSRLSCFWTFVRSAHFFSLSLQFQIFLCVFWLILSRVLSWVFFFQCAFRVPLYTEGETGCMGAFRHFAFVSFIHRLGLKWKHTWRSSCCVFNTALHPNTPLSLWASSSKWPVYQVILVLFLNTLHKLPKKKKKCYRL